MQLLEYLSLHPHTTICHLLSCTLLLNVWPFSSPITQACSGYPLMCQSHPWTAGCLQNGLIGFVWLGVLRCSWHQTPVLLLFPNMSLHLTHFHHFLTLVCSCTGNLVHLLCWLLLVCAKCWWYCGQVPHLSILHVLQRVYHSLACCGVLDSWYWLLLHQEKGNFLLNNLRQLLLLSVAIFFLISFRNFWKSPQVNQK